MFDLEHAIAKWRQQMAAGGIKTPSILDELESHLREEMEQQIRSGMTREEAFHAAVKRIGPPGALKNEFEKSGAVSAVLEKLMIVVAAVVVAFGIFLTSATMILCYGSFGERFAGFTALGALLLAVFGWPRIVPFLPVIHEKGKRLAIEVACLLLGFGLTTFYVQVILSHFDARHDGLIPAVGFWGLLPIAIGFGLACGIERAVQRSPKRITA